MILERTKRINLNIECQFRKYLNNIPKRRSVLSNEAWITMA